MHTGWVFIKKGAILIQIEAAALLKPEAQSG